MRHFISNHAKNRAISVTPPLLITITQRISNKLVSKVFSQNKGEKRYSPPPPYHVFFVVVAQALSDFKTSTILVYKVLNGKGGLTGGIYEYSLYE